MSDGRVKKHSQAERFCEAMIIELGYSPIKDFHTGEAPTVEIPQHWTPYPHHIDLAPDHRVDVKVQIIPTSDAVETLRKVVLVDGWHFHHRTLDQEQRDDRHDLWYMRAGFHVIHVTAEMLMTKEGREHTKPQLEAALISKNRLLTIPIHRFTGVFG